MLQDYGYCSCFSDSSDMVQTIRDGDKLHTSTSCASEASGLIQAKDYGSCCSVRDAQSQPGRSGACRTSHVTPGSDSENKIMPAYSQETSEILQNVHDIHQAQVQNLLSLTVTGSEATPSFSLIPHYDSRQFSEMMEHEVRLAFPGSPHLNCRFILAELPERNNKLMSGLQSGGGALPQASMISNNPCFPADQTLSSSVPEKDSNASSVMVEEEEESFYMKPENRHPKSHARRRLLAKDMQNEEERRKRLVYQLDHEASFQELSNDQNCGRGMMSSSDVHSGHCAQMLRSDSLTDSPNTQYIKMLDNDAQSHAVSGQDVRMSSIYGHNKDTNDERTLTLHISKSRSDKISCPASRLIDERTGIPKGPPDCGDMYPPTVYYDKNGYSSQNLHQLPRDSTAITFHSSPVNSGKALIWDNCDSLSNNLQPCHNLITSQKPRSPEEEGPSDLHQISLNPDRELSCRAASSSPSSSALSRNRDSDRPRTRSAPCSSECLEPLPSPCMSAPPSLAGQTASSKAGQSYLQDSQTSTMPVSASFSYT